MEDDPVSKALEDVRRPLIIYLADLGSLMQAPPQSKHDLGLLAQNRLHMLKEALALARQKYGVPLPDTEVITFGIKCLNAALQERVDYALWTGSTTDGNTAAEMKQTLEAILRDTSATSLPKLLDFARRYNAQPVSANEQHSTA